MAIADYLNKLVQLKNDLVTTLRNKGVEVSDDEKLNTLVTKVNEVEGKQDIELVDEVPEDYNFSDSIKSVAIPYGVKNIKDYAFYYYNSYVMWSNFEKVEIPDSVVSIGNSAFQTSSRNLKDLTIPMSVESIGKNAFSAYTGNVIVPRNATVGGSAFYSAAVLCPSEGTDISNAPWGAYNGKIHDFDENGVCKICGHKAKIIFGERTGTFGSGYLNSLGDVFGWSTSSGETGTFEDSFTMTVLEETTIPIRFYWKSLVAYSTDSITIRVKDLNTQNNIYYYYKYGKNITSTATIDISTTVILSPGTYEYYIRFYKVNTWTDSGNYCMPTSCNW